jgi:hypothetical protein
MAYERQGTFDDLNNALFAQMDRLANASGEDVEKEIERSRAVGNLAGNIIANYNTAINLMRFQASEGMDLAGTVAMRPKMLGGVKVEQVKTPTPQEVADPWITDNAENHTVTYMADRLGWTHEDVVSACDRLGVAPKSLDYSKRSYREVSDAEYKRAMRRKGA